MIPPKAIEKLEKRISLLAGWRYQTIAPVALDMAETSDHFRTPPINMDFAPAPIGARWGRHWGTVWFRGRVEVPRECKGRRVFYRHDSIAEKLLFVDGKPHSGLDLRHKEALLWGPARGGETAVLHIEAYCGHPFPGVDGHAPYPRTLHSVGNAPFTDPPLTLDASDLVVEREAVAQLYYAANVLLRTAKLLDNNSLRRAAILDGLNAALDLVPVHWTTEEELDAAARAAFKHLAPLLKCKNSPTTPFAAITGHAHIDVGWLWPVKESIRKAARTFSSALALMDDYPDFRFLQSQPALYAMVEEHYPDLLTRIKKRVKEGRWEPNGGMWVEADCNVSGGEALVRQLLEGRKKTMELFGYKADTLWLPDVFGYAAALPQILRKSGITSFVTNKINWNDTNRFPYDMFWWEGIDGTDIFTMFITGRIDCYNGIVTPEFVQDAWDHVLLKECQDSVLQPCGFGDGGGGVTREMAEQAKVMRDLEGCPRTEWVNVSQFLKQQREAPVKRPRWVGELYLELHRGTYTSEARVKRFNRKLELLLRETELYCVMAMPLGYEYPADALQKYWRILLTNQFHDILPGSSIRQVYETAEAEYEQTERELAALRDAALACLGKACVPDNDHAAWLVANPLSWHMDTALATIPAPGFDAAVDIQGAPLQTQPIPGGLAVRVPIASLSAAPIALRTKEPTSQGAPSPFTYSGKTLETPHYRMTFDKAGFIACLHDKAARREVAAQGKRLNALYTADDLPINWDAWDIDRYYRDTIRFEERLISREVVADGPLFLTLRSEYAVGQNSTLTQDLTVYAHARRIDFATDVQWDERHKILKAGFGVDVHAAQIRCDIQYGHALRNRHPNTPWDRAKFEICAHKWVDVSEPGYGVALLNDCKYGHDTLDGMISITLLKSALAPDDRREAGLHRFTYALLPHPGDFTVETVVREAYALNQQLRALPIKEAAGNETALECCTVDNPNVIVEAVKKAEADDAVIVRLYEAGGTRGPVAMQFLRPPRKVYECDLMEENDQTAKLQGDTVLFETRPFEIRTFKVYFR